MYKIIEETEKLIVESIICVIFGEPGIGKTSLAFTSESPVLEDYDGGIGRAVNRKTAVTFDKWEDAVQFHNSGELEKMGVKTIVIDTAGSLLDNYMGQYVIADNNKNGRSGGQLSLQGYGALKSTFSQFINWAKAQKKDIVLVCHSEQFKEGDNTKYRPKMTGGSYEILIANADMVGYMKSINNKRTIDFNPNDEHIGKNTAEFPVIEIPHYASEENSNFMGKMIQDTKNKMMSLSESQQKSLDRITVIRDKISAATSYEKLKEMKADFEGLAPIERIQLEKLYNEQATFIISVEIVEASKIVQFNSVLANIKEQPSPKALMGELKIKVDANSKITYDTVKLQFVGVKADSKKEELKTEPKGIITEDEPNINGVIVNSEPAPIVEAEEVETVVAEEAKPKLTAGDIANGQIEFK